ncbi:hypothetical protein [Flavobacterium sp. NRK F7]|uniref:hypothetical protein n=1 Tax=Flavobacterium sp. NRK F7 TaxID=2954930 RepID=UPI002090807F|nr:hypothetical protein [Flavobacterium sp. NRK F7]MCO6163949.1 hypothetical protein [Flavobacterium sp. NRK F7]
MKTSNKKAMRQAILNYMKNDSYTKKEEIYAQLIINVMEEANKFGKNLDNVFINHNIIEDILLTSSVTTYLHDAFGRSKDEFPTKFIKVCNELKQQFDSDYPNASEYNEKYVDLYYTSNCFGVRIFMRKIISRIVFPLGIEVKVQPLFVRLGIHTDGMLNIAWEKGKKGGVYVMQDDCEIARNLTESEMKLLEDQINEAIRLNSHEVLEFDDLADIIDAFVAQAA